MSSQVCSRCGGHSTYVEVDCYDNDLVCFTCGARRLLKREPSKTPIYIPEIIVKPARRLRGISRKLSQEIYASSPAGKATWERYRRSELYKEAHARHRQTDKYKESQLRYQIKCKMGKLITRVLSSPIPTCPLGLFHKEGKITINKVELCNFHDGNCTLTCIVIEEI